jgi:subtilisin family serine protease
MTTGSQDVLVGVIDSGINGNHPDLVNRINIPLSRDFIGEAGGGLIDPIGHGTHVAGVIGAQGNNTIGIAGVAWNIRLVSLRVLNANGTLRPNGGHNDVAQAINHARTNSIKILNCSISIGYNNSENQTIRAAIASFDGLFINSAGNYNSNTNNNPRYEGFPNVIVVGASNNDDNRWVTSHQDGSNFGSTSVHLFAPGTAGGIRTTCHTGGYVNMGRTSSAAPHVTGVAALIWSDLTNPQNLAFPHHNITPGMVKKAILDGVDRPAGLNGLSMTNGRLNALGALQAARTQTAANPYGIHNIRNVGSGLYLNRVNDSEITQVVYSTATSRQWVVQKLNGTTDYQIRTVMNTTANFGQLSWDSSNRANIHNTSSLLTNRITVANNGDGTVTFRRGNQALGIEGNVNTFNARVVWQTHNASNRHQRWHLEPIQLSYQIGDVDRNGELSVMQDINMIQNHLSTSSFSLNAVQFYLADANRDGNVNISDVIEIQRSIAQPRMQTPLNRYW